MIETVTKMRCDVCRKLAECRLDGSSLIVPDGFVAIEMRPCVAGHVHKGHACSEHCAADLAKAMYAGKRADCTDCRLREGMQKR